MTRTPLIRAPGKIGLFMLVNVVVLFFLLIAFGREYVGNAQIDREIRALEEEKARLEDEQLGTLDLIQELSSEQYLEKEARIKHNLAEEGETLVVIQDDEPVGAIDETIFEEKEIIPNPKAWYFYFFDSARFKETKTL